MSSLLLSVAIVILPAPASAAGMPPQLPSTQDLARLQNQMSSALSGVRAGQQQLDAVVRAFEDSQSKLESLNSQIGDTRASLEALSGRMGAVKGSMNARAASTYRYGPPELVGVLMDARTFRQFSTAVNLIAAVIRRDSLVLTTVSEAREKTLILQAQLDTEFAQQQAALAELQKKQSKIQGALEVLGKQYEAVKARFDNTKAGFVFPVRAPYSYVDTWGAPRPGGRKHQGTDIFALRGTPVYAVVSGVIERFGVNAIGGNRLWVRSPADNWSYYYAHMSAYAPGIGNGTRVSKGQVLGYVGTSGNAAGTPPHLHFESHEPDNSATNPVPILRRVNPLK